MGADFPVTSSDRMGTSRSQGVVYRGLPAECHRWLHEH